MLQKASTCTHYIIYKQVCIKDVHTESTITSEHKTRHTHGKAAR